MSFSRTSAEPTARIAPPDDFELSPRAELNDNRESPETSRVESCIEEMHSSAKKAASSDKSEIPDTLFECSRACQIYIFCGTKMEEVIV